MNKKEALDALFTARWALNQFPPKVPSALEQVTRAIDALTDAEEQLELPVEDEGDPKDTGTPRPSDPLSATLVLIVGHEKKAPGADFALGGSEYQYNSDIAKRAKEYAARKYPNLKVEIVFRDGVGISGAYRKAKALKADACIELHFNAFNGQAQGTETLCSVEHEDRKFAEYVHNKICEVFERAGKSRGVKALSRSARGGQSIYSMPGSANCLVEPFFGDNKAEAKMADERRIPYAVALLEGAVEWLKHHALS